MSSVSEGDFKLKLNDYVVKDDKKNKFILTPTKYSEIVCQVKSAMEKKRGNAPLTTLEYRRLKRYDILTIGDVDKLIEKRISDEEQIRYFCHTDELYSIIHKAHIETGHKRTRCLDKELKLKYCNITRDVINIYLSLCQTCQLKKKQHGRGLVVRPILSNILNSRGQVDLVDIQTEPDKDYKFILNYQDHLTKFVFLKPLKSKRAEEVAYNLLDIFCIVGAPFILQSDNGREFTASVIKELADMFNAKIVHGKPRHSQSQGSVERANQDVRDILVTWMAENNSTSWSEGLRFVQLKKNKSFHRGINRSPYEAMFGVPLRNGLADSSLPLQAIPNLCHEEDLEKLVNSQDQPEPELSNNSDEDEVDPINNLVEHEDETPSGSSSEECPCTKSETMCKICERKNKISEARTACKISLKRQAEEMLNKSNKKFPPVNIGQTVLVKIPEVDRGRTAPRNVMGVVMNVTDNLYQLGTKSGIIQKMYARNEFQVANEQFLKVSDVPSKQVSLRTAAAVESQSKQGFVRCGCRNYCSNKKCFCVKNNVKCNSKCHSSLNCRNK